VVVAGPAGGRHGSALEVEKRRLGEDG
jgi:hypothetical protein